MCILLKIRKCRYTQYIAAIIATLTATSNGMYGTWPSPLLPKLTSNNSPIGIKLTNEQGSWMVAIYVLSTTLVSPFVGPIVNKLGPKRTLLLSSVPTFTGWMMCVFAKSATTLILARLVGGIGGGISLAVLPIYISEISSKDIRGKLAAMFNVLKLTGNLFVLTAGPFLSYNALTWSCSALSIIFAIAFYHMPESPHYLTKKGDDDKAEEALSKLINVVDKTALNAELGEIKNLVEVKDGNSNNIRDLITKHEHRKCLLIILGIKTVQQFSGFGAIQAYLQTIINSSNSNISSELSSVITGFIQIPAGITALFLVDRLGRKFLFITSATTCGIALMIEGTYLYLQLVEHQELSNVRWLPSTLIIFYLVMHPVGLFSVPYVLMGELFAPSVKSTAVPICVGYGGLIAFLAIKFFEPISDAWGMYTSFWIFAGVCLVGSVFTYFALPETKGKSFAEIQEKIRKLRS